MRRALIVNHNSARLGFDIEGLYTSAFDENSSWRHLISFPPKFKIKGQIDCPRVQMTIRELSTCSNDKPTTRQTLRKSSKHCDPTLSRHVNHAYP